MPASYKYETIWNLHKLTVQAQDAFLPAVQWLSDLCATGKDSKKLKKSWLIRSESQKRKRSRHPTRIYLHLLYASGHAPCYSPKVSSQIQPTPRGSKPLDTLKETRALDGPWWIWKPVPVCSHHSGKRLLVHQRFLHCGHCPSPLRVFFTNLLKPKETAWENFHSKELVLTRGMHSGLFAICLKCQPFKSTSSGNQWPGRICHTHIASAQVSARERLHLANQFQLRYREWYSSTCKHVLLCGAILFLPASLALACQNETTSETGEHVKELASSRLLTYPGSPFRVSNSFEYCKRMQKTSSGFGAYFAAIVFQAVQSPIHQKLYVVKCF